MGCLWMNPRSPGDLVGAGWSTQCMARTLDVFSRTDEITRAICGLLHTGGIEAVTVRAIAEAVGYDLWNATVWLAWCELARHADGPGQAVAEAHLHELWQLRHARDRPAPLGDPPRLGPGGHRWTRGGLSPRSRVQPAAASARARRSATIASGSSAA